jgi:hypothetical protein
MGALRFSREGDFRPFIGAKSGERPHLPLAKDARRAGTPGESH